MSQLNNEENNSISQNQVDSNFTNNQEMQKKIKKKHPVRNMILFILLFAVVCAGVTYYLIYKKNNGKTFGSDENNVNSNADSTSKQSVQVADDGLGLKSLNETYKRNNLMINIVEDGSGPLIESYGRTYHKIEIKSIKISCLKNTEIQDKINSEIEQNVNAMKTKCDEVGDYRYANINAMCTANFADTLSIIITGNYFDGKTTKYFDNVYLNYDLSTGNKIQFKDMFTNTAAVKSILSKSAYDTAISNPGTIIYRDENKLDETPIFSNDEEYNARTEMSDSLYEELEVSTFKFVNDYNNGGEYNFYFSPRSICVENKYSTKNKIVVIPIKDYYSQIAIYNRFKSQDNLYDGYSDYIPNDNLPVLVPSNGSGIAYDILLPGGPIEMKYMNFIKASDGSIYYVYIHDTKATLRETMNNCLEKVNAIISDYKSKNDGKCRFVEISVSNDIISIGEYIYSGSNKDGFISGAIGYFQDGYWTLNQEYYIKENKHGASAWKDTINDFSNISYSKESFYKDDDGSWISKEQYLNKNKATDSRNNVTGNNIINNTPNNTTNNTPNNTTNNTINNTTNNTINNTTNNAINNTTNNAINNNTSSDIQNTEH